MLLLAVDTSGKNGSIALARVTPGQSEIEVLEVVPLAGGAFSAQLVPQIAALLEKHGHSKSDLGGFAVVSGPGSFTGLRVGLAAIKALAEVLQKPIVAVSLLEAVACEWRNSRPGSRGARCGPRRRLCRRLRTRPAAHMRQRTPAEPGRISYAKAGAKTVVTPDPVGRGRSAPRESRSSRSSIRTARVIARLGWLHLERGETVSSRRHSKPTTFAVPTPKFSRSRSS